jgi:ABC-type glycerol-3-phosphate transport system substrate-binding protein
MMKRTFALFLLIVLLVVACGSNDAPASDASTSNDTSEAGEEAVVQPGDAIVTVFRAPT